MPFRFLAASLFLTLAIIGCDSTGPDEQSVWSSSDASLTISQSSATLRILAGSCYGSYGEINRPIPSGNFTLSGTFTQLIGAYPGSVQYDAQYSGTVAGSHMTLTVTVPALQKVIGPFTLTEGVSQAWMQCLYP